MNSIDIFEKLTSKNSFNVFVGAGISRNSPANAPIWREIQKKFISDLFDIVKTENWFPKESMDKERSILLDQDFRPEQFWEMIQIQTSLAFVSNCLKTLDQGQPNLCHKVIAHCIENNVAENIITTNFDEYIEKACLNYPDFITVQSDIEKVKKKSTFKNAGKILFKIHGSLSNPKSLLFTLKHLDRLPDWKKELLIDLLKKRPLLIAGYSGYDEDILPILKQINNQIPFIIIVAYPGSSETEPVKELITNHPKNILIERDINKIVEDWVNNIPAFKNIVIPEDRQKINWTIEDTLARLSVPYIPYIISSLFSFSGHRKLAAKYAETAVDAVEEPKYSFQIDDSVKNQITLNCYILTSITGINLFSKVKLNKITEFNNLPNNDILYIQINRIWGISIGQNSTKSELAEALLFAKGILNVDKLEININAYLKFRVYWIIARINSRNEDHNSAIEAYLEADNFMPEKDIQEYMKGSFYLDYGSAIFSFCYANKTELSLHQAHNLFLESEKISTKASDFITLVQSKIMLSKINVWAGNINNAQKYCQEAKTISQDTGDNSLINRTTELENYINNCKVEFNL